ncbi:hypothetical protein OIU79_001683 [Salix purpurea]|uniref:Uncharacterized protein n=1 Tax=Salix purpurea TaxID=77065 RepID=A0A9Q0URB5_SALPP|nr:hypothetical protein OIU79_001683 [Salix purpurea]
MARLFIEYQESANHQNPVFCFSMALDPMQCGIMAWKNQIFPGSMRYEARLMEAVHGVHRMNLVIRISYGGFVGYNEAATILLPETPEKLRELIRLSLVKLAKGVPSFFLTDVIDEEASVLTNVQNESLKKQTVSDTGRARSNFPTGIGAQIVFFCSNYPLRFMSAEPPFPES